MEVVAKYRFERMVAEALDDLPDELQHVLDNVVVQKRCSMNKLYSGGEMNMIWAGIAAHLCGS